MSAVKAARKKMPKGNFLLFFSFVAISLCLLLVVSAIRAERMNRINKYELYSGNQRSFTVSGGEGVEQWEQIVPELASDYDSFSLYLPVRDSEYSVRGICHQGGNGDIPVIWGQYFDFETSWTDEPKIVLGSHFTNDIVSRDGKRYYTFGEQEFEVIGIIGMEEESRVNYMMLLDFKSVVRMIGLENDYILDAGADDIQKISQDLYDNIPFPSQVRIKLTKDRETTFRERFFSANVIMDTMYVMILLSFSLSTVLVTLIWFRFRRSLFLVWKLCGYRKAWQRMEIGKQLYLITGIGVGTGLLLLGAISRRLDEIRIVPVDVGKAFAVTVGLGTAILLLCFLLDGRKSKK